MSLGTSGAALPRDLVETIKIEPRSTTASGKREMNLITQGHLQAYLEEAMERFNKNKGSERIKTSILAKIPRLQE